MGVAGLEPELVEVAGVEGDGGGDGYGERSGLADGEEFGGTAGAFALGFQPGDIEGQGGGGEGVVGMNEPTEIVPRRCRQLPTGAGNLPRSCR